MDWLSADFIGALTPSAVLLLVSLGSVYMWYRDRNARLKELQQQVDDWREAYRLSELAREKHAETTREALEVARTAEEALRGFRAATAWASREEP